MEVIINRVEYEDVRIVPPMARNRIKGDKDISNACSKIRSFE